MSEDQPKVASLVPVLEAKERERLTPPDQAGIVGFLEDMLAKAKRGEVWAVGIVAIERPKTEVQATAWNTTVGYRGIDQCPFTFLGAAVRMLGMAERGTAGLPATSDDAGDDPPPKAGA